MAKYVDADKLRLEIKNMGLFETAKFIKTFPSEDVSPVIHAHWIKAFFPGSVECGLPILLDATCSHCDFKMEELYSYCPNCGAIMDEEVNK